MPAAARGWQFRWPSVIPGFGLTLGFTIVYLTLIILIPLSGVAWRSSALGWSEFLAVVFDERTLKALQISFGASLIAAAGFWAQLRLRRAHDAAETTAAVPLSP